MTAHTVTRCPQCGTSFRITPMQLQSAKGAVRCGSCLHIFRAQDHLVGQEKTVVRSKPAAPKTTAAATAKAPTAPKAKTPNTNAPTVVRKPAPPAAKKPAVTPPAPKKPQTGLSFDQSQIDDESALPDNGDDFLIDDNMDQPKGDDSAYGSGFSDDFLEIEGAKTSLFERKAREKTQEIEDDADESWAMSLLEDDNGDEDEQIRLQPAPRADEQEATFKPAPERVEQPQAKSKAEPDKSHVHARRLEEDDADEAPYTSPASLQHSERAALLMRIDPEPLELSAAVRRPRSRRKGLWAVLSLLALILLVAQVAWLQFDRLNRLQPYRAVYELVCPLLGCEVPDLIDRRQISAAHLIVRSHPRLDNALEVNLMLLNNAPFDQPFPDLVLEFSDLQEQILAVRRFTPDEYLAGELAGRRLMPRNQPVRLTLELVHPGPTAVNYRAYIPD